MDYKKIKSYEDACKALGLEPIANEVFNAFPKEDRKTMEAYHKLSIITRAINEGWQPDWSNRDEPKYEPYMYTNSAGLACAATYNAPSYTTTDIGSRLCFSDYERAAFAVRTFGDTLYKEYFRPENYEEREQEAAEKKEQSKENENGGGEKRIIDDLSDAPDFLQKTGKIMQEYIEPLQEEDKENRGIILISIQDNAKDEDANTGLATTFAVAGNHDVLARGLARFIQNEHSKDIVKSAVLYVKIEKMLKNGAKIVRDIIDNILK